MEQELLAEVKRDYLKITDTDTEVDDFILNLLAYVDGYIFEHYGIAVYEREKTERMVTFYGSHRYFTKWGIITEIVKIEMDGEDVTSELQSYLFTEKNEIFLSNTSTVMFRNNSDTIIKYKVGYAQSGDIPRGLKNVLFQIVKKLYTDISKNMDSFTSMSTGIKEAVKIEDSLPFVAKQILESYRIYRI